MYTGSSTLLDLLLAVRMRSPTHATPTCVKESQSSAEEKDGEDYRCNSLGIAEEQLLLMSQEILPLLCYCL